MKMNFQRASFAILTLAILFAGVTELSSEQLTVTTYYPAPSGIYNQMVTTDQTILARNSGNVGIGTGAPAAKLEVVGGAIKATDGLIIEARTSDPASPVVGQIWLRSDL